MTSWTPMQQKQREEDERKDRTEFLPDNMSRKDWTHYFIRQVYLAMLTWGGDWNQDLRKEKKNFERSQ